MKLLALTCALCAMVALAPRAVQAAPEAVDAAPQEKVLGIAGFPALEILPGRDENMVVIVARESALQGPINYSSGYFTGSQKFVPPQAFSFSIYGYYAKPQWGSVKSVEFKFGKQTFSAKPLYVVQGPDRDRSQDAQNSDYFETMIIQLPPDVARKIVENKGVLVTTTPKSFYLPISASQLDRFKQLVGSVAAISKNTRFGAQIEGQANPGQADDAPGLPISELANDQTNGKALQTEVTDIAPNFAIQMTAYTHDKGKKLPTPEIELLVATVGAKPIWSKVNQVTLSYGAKNLQLVPDNRNANTADDGKSVEIITVTVPYADFAALAKADKFTITLANDSYEVGVTQATGIRELARRLGK